MRGVTFAQSRLAMIKLTRLNHQIMVVNPDHIYAAEARPDTTLRLLNGETIIVRESLDELIEKVIEYRQQIGGGHNPVAVASLTPRHDDDGNKFGGV